MQKRKTMPSSLFTRKDYLHIKDVFQLLIDNQMNEDELYIFLKKNHIDLPPSFFSLSLEQKKKYLQLEILWVDPKTLKQKHQFVWNANYFYELARKAKKSITATSWLMEYCRYLDSRPIYFLTMQHIKIKNIPYFKNFYPDVLIFASKKKINTLYNLFMEVLNNNCDKIIQKHVLSYFKKESSEFFFDISYFPNAFSIAFEQLLYSLNDSNLANKIRVLFLIYKKEYLENPLISVSALTMKNFLQSVGTKSLSSFLKFAKSHQEEIDKMAPNGYRAFYYSVLVQKENIL